MPRGVYTRTPEILASLRAAAEQRATGTGMCHVADCDRPSSGRRANICEVHYYRLRRTGTTDLRPSKRKHPPTYRNAHRWVQLDRGKAADHACIDCDEPAAHWSFDHRRVPESEWLWCYDNGKRPYSGDAQDYDPRCARCASRYDRAY